MSEGLLLAQRFQLLAKLGEGGMGSVWCANDLTLGAQVAIKLIDPGIGLAPEAVGRFRREAQAAAALRSAHVVQILDYGVDQGQPFIAMELLEGESLGARLRRLDRLSAGETAQILSQVAKALARAHERGIVHRDLKPENIFLVRDGVDEIAKVLDFGIAKQTGALNESTGVKTHTGVLLGTPYYMSPEQALGQPGIDFRADLWSFGIIAYECITGTRPFQKDTLGALLMSICNDTPLPPSRVGVVPQGFDDWFARAIAREPAARFSSALEASGQLSALSGYVSARPSATAASADQRPATADGLVSLGQTVAPASVTVSPSQRRSSRRRRLVVVAGALSILAAGGIATRFASNNGVPSVPLTTMPATAAQTATLDVQATDTIDAGVTAAPVASAVPSVRGIEAAADPPAPQKKARNVPVVASASPTAPVAPQPKGKTNRPENFGF